MPSLPSANQDTIPNLLPVKKKKKLLNQRWQEYTELYKEGLNDPNNHYGMVTHLGPDIPECEVRWAIGQS